MDLASLSNEIKQKNLPPLVAGWTNDEFFKLLEMYSNKCTLQTMAVHFSKSRGQISGVLHRARQKGLVKQVRERLIAAPAKPAKAARAKLDPATLNVAKLVQRLVKQKAKKQRVRLRLIDDSNQVTFAQLEPHHCRWPIGDPRQSDFRFCGCRRVLQKPYCEAHVMKAGKMYEKATEAR